MKLITLTEDLQPQLLSLYRALLKCDQAIIRSTSQTQLFDEICRHVVNLGAMNAVWIGMLDKGDTRLWPQAHFGVGRSYFESIELNVQVQSPNHRDPAGTAIFDDCSVWSQDILSDPAMLGLRDLAKVHGWHSAAAIPLRVGTVPVGVLSIYANEPGVFDDLARKLLTQLASNISYALDFFEHDAQRQQAEFDLFESEVRYNALFSSSCMPMLVVDPDNGRIVDANIRAINFYGWDQATFKSMNIMDINVLSPDQIRQEMAFSVSTNKSYFDFQHRLASGDVRDVEVFTSPIDYSGHTYLMSAVHDVTERRSTENRMRSAQMLTQRFIDQLPGVAFVKDSKLRLLMVNKNLGNVLGVDPQTLIGKTAHDIFPQDFAETVTKLDHEMLAQGGSRTFEEVFNGHHNETSMFVMDDGTGERFLGGLSLDVTERKHADERTRALLRISELGGHSSEKEFLTDGLELAQSLTHSNIGFLHFVNDDQETLELVTWTASALMGCTASYDGHYPVSQAGIWADCVRRSEPVIFNDYAGYVDKRGLPDGHTPLTRLISVPVIENGLIRMMIGVGNKTSDYDDHDVDDLRLLGNDMWRIVRRVRVEKALKQRVEELVTANRSLADIQMQLLQSEKMAAIGQLAAGVAHEINNPIAFVKSNLGSLAIYVEQLLEIIRTYQEVELQLGESFTDVFKLAQAAKKVADFDFLAADLPTLIVESREGVDRVSKIVVDLKNFARVGDTEFQWADLHAALESTINVVWNELKYKADVVRDYGQVPQIRCVVSQINQVVMNLLVNAAQSITGQGCITIRTGRDGEQVWIEVQDTGCGIAAEKQSRIFDPFYTTKPAGQGTGLGLSIAFGIVKQHRGTLIVRSVPGHGSTFRMTLPIDARNSPVAPAGEGVSGEIAP